MRGVVIAAGVGSRMERLTATRPKCLLPIAGRPLLAHTVDNLRAAGCDEVVVVVGYRAETIHMPGITRVTNLDYRSNNILQSFMSARAHLKGPVMVTYSDIWVEPWIYRELARASGDIVLAVDRDNSTLLGEGKLAVIDNQIDTTTGTIRLKANFPNDDLRLWPGQFANARMLLSTRRNGLVVPASVIQRGPEGPYAFVIKNDQSVEVRPVKVAQIEKDEALIDEGLQLNERVVVDGQYKLQVGSHVKPASSVRTGGSGS